MKKDICSFLLVFPLKNNLSYDLQKNTQNILIFAC
jgi:hypothetical protein